MILFLPDQVCLYHVACIARMTDALSDIGGLISSKTNAAVGKRLASHQWGAGRATSRFFGSMGDGRYVWEDEGD